MSDGSSDLDGEDPMAPSSSRPRPVRQSLVKPLAAAVPQIAESSPEPRDRSRDDSDIGWGDESRDYGDDWYLGEKPPHHD